jgi:hypothetical protein
VRVGNCIVEQDWKRDNLLDREKSFVEIEVRKEDQLITIRVNGGSKIKSGLKPDIRVIFCLLESISRRRLFVGLVVFNMLISTGR